MELNPHGELSVVLVYSEYLPTSITELIFYSQPKVLDGKITPEFKEALEILKNRYRERISHEMIKVLHSNTKGYLTNFLEANAIDEIYIPKTYRLRTPGMSFDPVPKLKKTNLPLFEMHWETGYNYSEHEYLTALFT